MRWLGSTTDSMDMGLSKLCEIVEDREGHVACCRPRGGRVGHNLVTEQQQSERKEGLHAFNTVQRRDEHAGNS